MAVVILCVDVAYVDLQTRFSMQTYTELGAEAVSSLSEGGLMFQASADRLDLTVFVAGAGQAGARVAQGLRAAGHRGAIVVVGEEVHAPYERPPLSKELLLGERTVEDLAVVSAVEWAALGVDTRLGLRVAGFDRDAGRARLSDGTTVDFDVAVIATGGTPRRLSVPGGDDPRLRVLRGLDDALALAADLRALAGTGRLAVVGAGVIGLEVASTARRLGVDVAVLEAGPRVMARVVSPDVSDWLADVHRAAGVALHLGTRLEAVEPIGSGFRLHHRGPSGAATLDADLVLVAIGIDPAVALAEGCGLPVGDGVIVDRFCRSPADPRFHAVGDVACVEDPATGHRLRLETWRNAENQARAVAEIILGRAEPFAETPWMWTSQHGHDLQVVGRPDPEAVVIRRGDPADGGFARLWWRDGRLVGGVLVDQGRDRRFLEQLVAEARPVDPAAAADPSRPLRSLRAG